LEAKVMAWNERETGLRNSQAVGLITALLGVIPKNVNLIILSEVEPSIKIKFFIDEGSKMNFYILDEIITDIYSMQVDDISVESEIIEKTGTRGDWNFPEIAVYMRKR
jgi:hypothetical protein